MNEETERFILDLLADHNILTLATVRPDGYPQAITVGYVNDGLTLYVGVGADSQKAANIAKDSRASLTVDRDYADWNKIKGLSMGGRAELVDDEAEIQRALDLMLKKFPQITELLGSDESLAEMDEMALIRITPEVISVLNYELGFGHTEMVWLD
ncbi:pyridoxamine 5'-phosphate oxidase family protein [Thiohalorhabdus sp. Cl-TMA]|uniref:Pyridoxamine 5'-phosphate oxidase family protein n=1 Tax=Thiohalorhabdus methylotrophus TaxID=3242694 RepID=A0ABV4TVM9_9GAMM